MINFVSNLPRNLRSGGFSGLNAAAFAAIRKMEDVNYAGPIDPPVLLSQKVRSKLLRMAGSRGDFFYFSQQRLEAIADAVRARCRPEARFDFFHGFTPWVLTRPPRPYIAWSDCSFSDYIDVYHRREQFRHEDLERIEHAEAAWLKNACGVFFTSDWAAQRAVRRYVLDASRVGVVGIFGEIAVPARDAYAGAKEFAFISTNFEAKGGPVVLAALREVRKRHPDASLVVVGDQPRAITSEPGVQFTGFLRKEFPDENRRLQYILGRARALVHPTKSDIAPLLIVEAGYFGCPVISSKRFAIPELVDDRRTGLLLDDPSQVNAVVGAMSWMLEHEDEYQRMREAVWDKAHQQHAKQQFEERLIARVRDAASGMAITAP